MGACRVRSYRADGDSRQRWKCSIWAVEGVCGGCLSLALLCALKQGSAEHCERVLKQILRPRESSESKFMWTSSGYCA